MKLIKLTSLNILCYAHAHEARAMPKKTKKAKLLAEAHRQPVLRRQPSISVQHTPQQAPIITSQITYSIPEARAKAQSTALHTEHVAIKHDLIKTVIFSAAIIISELLLSRYLK